MISVDDRAFSSDLSNGELGRLKSSSAISIGEVKNFQPVFTMAVTKLCSKSKMLCFSGHPRGRHRRLRQLELS